ncbi:MAG TPA: hypothetical protein VNX28_18280 [Gemmataceae bacterium]|nr:hypothetical protein [Gemmataceae bacterium]
MKFQIGAMTVGDILDRGLKMLLANLPAFYLINLMVLWPVIIFQIAFPMVAPPDSPASIFIGIWIALILAIIVQPIGSAAMLHIISQDFVDQRVTIGSAIRFAMRRFGSLLGTSILTGIVVGVGLCLCGVPGVLFYVWYALFAQIVVVENLGGMNALNRSKTLTEGFRWRVFGVLILVIVISLITQYSVALLLERVIPSYDLLPVPKKNQFDMGFRLVAKYPNLWINLIVAWLISILVQAYGTICVTLLYFDLRNRKEGFDLELAAREQQTAEQP